MDLSNDNYCITHDLLIAKFEAFSLDKISLNILFDDLNIRKQRTKIGTFFSFSYDIIAWVSQGSILGHLLFSIFTKDLFLLQSESKTCNFVDDKTLYGCKKNMDDFNMILI